MNLAIVGSRYYNDYKFMKLKVNEFCKEHGKPVAIISGGASGVDTMAKRYAHEYDIEFIEYKADWKKYGLYAGPKRNTQIVQSSTHLIAFPSRNGKGTQNCIKQAKKNDIEPMVIYID